MEAVDDEDDTLEERVVTKVKICTLDEVLDMVGDGPYQRWLLWVCALSFGADSTEVMVLSFISACARADWRLSGAQASSIAAVVFLGELLGAAFWGVAADHHGRRPIFVAAVLVIFAAGMASVLAPNFWALLALRGVVGFGLGGLFVPYDLLAEFVRSRHRGRYLMLVWVVWSIGAAAVVGAAAALLPLAGGWRRLAAASALPAGLSLLSLKWLPESPRWLLAKGRSGEALAVLRAAAAANGRPLPVGTLLAREDHHVTARAASEGLEGAKELWRSGRAVVTAPVWALWFLFGVGYYGVVLLSGRVFEVPRGANGTNASAADSACAFDYSPMALIALSELLGTFAVTLTIDRYGRRASQGWGYLAAAVCILPLGFTSSRAAATASSVAVRAAIMGATSATWVHLPEVYTTEIRATAHAAANVCAKLGAFVSPYWIDSTFSLRAVALGLAVSFVFSAMLALLLPETAGRGIDAVAAATTAEYDAGHNGEGNHSGGGGGRSPLDQNEDAEESCLTSDSLRNGSRRRALRLQSNDGGFGAATEGGTAAAAAAAAAQLPFIKQAGRNKGWLRVPASPPPLTQNGEDGEADMGTLVED